MKLCAVASVSPTEKQPLPHNPPLRAREPKASSVAGTSPECSHRFSPLETFVTLSFRPTCLILVAACVCQALLVSSLAHSQVTPEADFGTVNIGSTSPAVTVGI